MAIPISVCCLLASPDREYQAWQTGFYWKDLAEEDATVAKEFIELDVDREGLSIGELTTDVLIGCIHPGEQEACEEITHADMEVDEDREIAQWPLEQTYTVCGGFLESGRCYSGLWVAQGPLLAYAAAWHHFHKFDKTLLLTGVHDGIVPRVPWTPVFMDPSVTNEVAMLSRLTELGIKSTP